MYPGLQRLEFAQHTIKDVDDMLVSRVLDFDRLVLVVIGKPVEESSALLAQVDHISQDVDWRVRDVSRV